MQERGVTLRAVREHDGLHGVAMSGWRPDVELGVPPRQRPRRTGGRGGDTCTLLFLPALSLARLMEPADSRQVRCPMRLAASGRRSVQGGSAMEAGRRTDDPETIMAIRTSLRNST